MYSFALKYLFHFVLVVMNMSVLIDKTIIRSKVNHNNGGYISNPYLINITFFTQMSFLWHWTCLVRQIYLRFFIQFSLSVIIFLYAPSSRLRLLLTRWVTFNILSFWRVVPQLFNALGQFNPTLNPSTFFLVSLFSSLRLLFSALSLSLTNPVLSTYVQNISVLFPGLPFQTQALFNSMCFYFLTFYPGDP